MASLLAALLAGCAESQCDETLDCPEDRIDANVPDASNVPDSAPADAREEEASPAVDVAPPDAGEPVRDASLDVADVIDAADASDAKERDVGAPLPDAPNDAAKIDAPAEAADSCNLDGSPATTSCLVTFEHGVFVSPTSINDQTDGSPAHPFKTLSAAIMAASATKKAVFACSSGGIFAEAISLAATESGVRIYGGFDCSTWAHTGSRTQVQTASGQIPLTISHAVSVRIEDFDFRAADATQDGQSSVAALVVASEGVALTRVALTAGAGKKGADGQSGDSASRSNYDPMLDSESSAIAGGRSEDHLGASGPNCALLCQENPNGVASAGGKGGDGSKVLGGVTAGTDGTPKHAPPSATESDGLGGAPQPSLSGDCTNGHRGSDAPPASAGGGARIYGLLGPSGWTPQPGADGPTGKPGQGGGGGGAGLSTSGTTGGGGGGGCGGCGGRGGGGGQGGGSSFALLSRSSSVSLFACVLSAGAAGAGGNGASGQIGQTGGAKGAVISGAGCQGGAGGKGGQGGPGGGGAGGVSVGIGFTGTPVSVDDATGRAIHVAASSAPGGAPGDGGLLSQDAGADAAAADADAAGSEAGGEGGADAGPVLPNGVGIPGVAQEAQLLLSES